MTSYANRNFAILTPFLLGLIPYLNEATSFRFPKKFHIFFSYFSRCFTVHTSISSNAETLSDTSNFIRIFSNPVNYYFHSSYILRLSPHKGRTLNVLKRSTNLGPKRFLNSAMPRLDVI